MSEKPQNQNEQLNMTPDSAAEPEFSLEEIMREFGGWTKREEEPVEPQTVQEEPEESVEAKEPEEPETVQEDAPEAESEAPEEEKPADDMQSTIRFAPITEEQIAEAQPKVWGYKGEPVPEDADLTDKELQRELKLEKKRVREENRRLRRIERAKRYQKLQQERKLRRQDRPEISFDSPEEAYAYYQNKSRNSPRLVVSVVLLLGALGLLAFGNLQQFGIDYAPNLVVISLLMLAVMLVQVALAYDVIVDGIMQILRLQIEQKGLLVIATAVSIVDAFFCLTGRRLPFCSLICGYLVFAQWGNNLTVLAKRRSMKTVLSMQEPSASVREEKAWHGKDCIFRHDADVDEYTRQIEMPDSARRIAGVLCPILLVLSLVLAVLSSIRSDQNFFWNWTALLVAAYPLGTLICYSRPFFNCAHGLAKLGAAVAGWKGAKNLAGDCGLIVEDGDLFPQSYVTLDGMKILTNRNVGQIVGFATAVVETAGSGLVPLFREIKHEHNGKNYTVDTFRRYEGGGLGAEIQGNVILMGSYAFMKLMRVQMQDVTKLRQAVYLSVNGDLAAVFALNYLTAEGVKSSLVTVLRQKLLVPVLATRDFMITPQFLRVRYKISTDRVEFPTVEERARLSSGEAVREPQQGALMCDRSFENFVSTVTLVRAMRRASVGSLAVSIIGSLIGMLMVFFLTFIGAVQTASAWNLLIFQVLWMLPQLLMNFFWTRR